MDRKPHPPHWAETLLRWRCPEDQLEEVQGDLQELFETWAGEEGPAKARRLYWLNVLGFLRPVPWRKPIAQSQLRTYFSANPFDMLLNYYKIAWRNLTRHKGYSAINIGGLAVGMAVAKLIGLWIYDELSFNKYHHNYDRIARVMEHVAYQGKINTSPAASPAFGNALRLEYGNDFTHVLMASNPHRLIVSAGEKKLMKSGYYFEPGIAEMLSLKMRYGTRNGLQDPASVLLSESLAKSLFGDADPVGKVVTINQVDAVKVTGVYEDLPQNSSFSDMTFIAPWSLYLRGNEWIKKEDWWQNGFQAFVQVADGADMAGVSAKIKDLKAKRIAPEDARKYRPQLFLFPMHRWRLHSDFENGVNTGGHIRSVWLFGTIGVFVLLLACINFMNLATARSGKRAREVGIRKVVGSARGQLVSQFMGESLLVVVLALVLALLLVQLGLPFFNDVAGKQLSILWTSPLFWLATIGFSLFTGLLAGSYPSLYLSSFQAVKVLKGTFRAGRSATIPRKVLVVVQFTVSITLIIGVLIVFRQIQFAKDRPVGYSRNGLVMVETPTDEIHAHIDAVREELKASGAITEISESLNPMTGVSFTQSGFDWKGTGPDADISFATAWVDHQFGKTVGWQFKKGRDFSRKFSTDSLGMVLNETAVQVMGLSDPVGKTIRWAGLGKPEAYQVIGVIEDMLMESPYAPVQPTIFMINTGKGNFVNLRINPRVSTGEALGKMEEVFKKHSPDAPFEYKFVDQVFARKFADEERIGNLTGFFTALAVFISCLGLFGLASFTAEQRTKEIGIRKVMGATVTHLWSLLSKDFLRLVLISFGVAAPAAYYFLSQWLQNYTYRTDLSWWVFALAGGGALLITLLTVSYQAIKTALSNPVKSLRNE